MRAQNAGEVRIETTNDQVVGPREWERHPDYSEFWWADGYVIQPGSRGRRSVIG